MKPLNEIITEAVSMQNLFPTRLDAKVAAVNKVNRLALLVLPHMHAALTPFLGKAVQNQDGGLQKRFRDALPKDDCHGRGAYCLQWYFKTSNYFLRAHFQTGCCVANSSGSGFGEVCITLAELVDGRLGALCSEGLALRSDYTAAWVLGVRAEIKAADAVLSKARSKLMQEGFSIEPFND